MMFLTATLPPQMQDRFEIELLLTCPRPKYIRIPTYRPTIEYSVVIIDDAELQEAAVDFIERQTSQSGDDDKILAFGPSVNLCKELSNTLGCSLYHARGEDKEEQLRA